MSVWLLSGQKTGDEVGHSEVASATGADLESARPSQGGPAEGDFESVVPRQEELERLHYRLLRLYLQVSNEATGWPFFFRKGWRSNRIESDLTGSLRPRRLASGALARWLIELHVKRISKQLALSYLRLEQVLKPSDDSALYSNFVKQARQSVERFAGSFSSFHRPRIVLTTVWPLLLALGVKVSLPEANQTLIAVLILIPLLIYLGPVTHFVLRASFLLKRELMLASGGEDGGAYQRTEARTRRRTSYSTCSGGRRAESYQSTRSATRSW